MVGKHGKDGDDDRRRDRGDGGVYYDKSRHRWVAEITVGYRQDGSRIRVKRRRKDKTQAKNAVKDLVRSVDDGVPIEPQNYTVGNAVRDWLRVGLRGCSQGTIIKNTSWANVHVLPRFERVKVPRLTADDVDDWLDEKAETHSTDSLRQMYSVLNRSVEHARKRDKVRRNVVALCTVPKGRPGRPSKSLTFEQASALLDAAEADDSTVGDYIVVSLTTGARTEEARELGWDLVDTEGKPDADPPVPPSIDVWRSVREGGDTKTPKSRRSLGVPQRAVRALERQRSRQGHQRQRAGEKWAETGLVFTTRYGTALHHRNVARAFRRIVAKAGLDAAAWTPRELRHSFVSLLDANDVPTEKISQLVGHMGTRVTEIVYRHQLRPVLLEGAEVMDHIFPVRHVREREGGPETKPSTKPEIEGACEEASDEQPNEPA